MSRPLLALAALCLLVCPPAARAAQGDEPTVQAVQVEGNRRVEIDAVKAVISQKAGEPLDLKKVDEDIRSVMKLGFFSDVTVEEQGGAERPTLVFRVVEKPAVREVKVEGADEISADDLVKEASEIKPFAILDLNLVRKSQKKIQEKYVEKGFYLAEVTWRLDPQPDNQTNVVFVVNEHAKVQVRQVNILGNAHVAKDEITPYMQTQEGGYLSFLNSMGNYKEEAFQRDLQAIQFIYGDKGYLYAKVGKPAVQISPDKKWLYISLHVDEGDQFSAGKVDFSGELLDQTPLLEKVVQVRPGMIFARSKVAKDIQNLQDVYKDLGYAYVNVNPVTNVHADTKVIDLTYDVQPGQKTYFERIEIVGNAKTRDKVIRRELRIYEGDLFSGTGINVSKQRVNALGYFEKVEITTKKGSADDKIVATVEVKERSTGTFQVGAGFSSYENFILTGQISQNNFFGWGQTLSLQIQYSSIRQLGQIQFVEPYFLDTRWTFAFDLYATEGIYSTFTRKAVGGTLTWGYELAGLAPWWKFARNLEDMRLFATYTNEFVSVTPTFTDILLANRYRSGTTSALRLSLQWDKRNDRLFPSSGYYESLSAEFAPPALAPEAVFGSRVNLFSRYTFESRYYHPLFAGVVGRLKLTAGYIRNWDDAHPVPVSELYYLGGINSVRGYRLLSISPQVLAGATPRPDAELTGVSVGGNKQLILNSELEIPLLEKVGVRGVVFFDMGNTFGSGQWSDPNVGLSLYKSVGFGLRWMSPIGPLRFEWGFPLNRRRDGLTGNWIDSSSDFQFTIGNFF
ncbi:outer membrane protein assembly factor BamA [Anaeromyxobacter paludicola]|uniref:Outer membrane protein assembly factor BamA n=1 Tax=Anaeromyxobacter paludicola TaxID=2918171 RepID=A0ABN6N8M7_9BACT|nr:outer membrane protein assembly factor BamA [Anaeromyxobacter paludicola]BDG08340.1 outer membrane protein assembly factor BamA [Anaeromyxobacter paludicola]